METAALRPAGNENARAAFTLRRMVFVLLALSCVQTWLIIPVGTLSLKSFHIFSVLCFPVFINADTVLFSSRRQLGLALSVLAVSLLAAIRYGWNAVLFNYLYGMYICVLCSGLRGRLSRGELAELCRKCALLLEVAVLIKAAWHYDVFIRFFARPYGHPVLPFFFGGGPNIEATWVAMFGVFFINGKGKTQYYIYMLAIACLYTSRAAVVLCVFVYSLDMWQHVSVRRIVQYALVLLGIGVVTLLLLRRIQGMYIVQRFMQIGAEAGSINRMTMWDYFLDAFRANPWGYGAGNSMLALTLASGRHFAENNIHNYYMQVVLDFGVVGAAFFFSAVIAFFKREWKSRFSNPFAAYILAYLVACLVQFRGAEPLFVLLLGMYLATLDEAGDKTMGVSRRRSEHTPAAYRNAHKERSERVCAE